MLDGATVRRRVAQRLGVHEGATVGGEPYVRRVILRRIRGLIWRIAATAQTDPCPWPESNRTPPLARSHTVARHCRSGTIRSARHGGANGWAARGQKVVTSHSRPVNRRVPWYSYAIQPKTKQAPTKTGPSNSPSTLIRTTDASSWIKSS